MQLLPIGSVVLLNNADKRTLIFGRCQYDKKTGIEYDYVGCDFPTGIQNSNQVSLFNHSDIKILFALGYQDVEEFQFRAKIEERRSET